MNMNLTEKACGEVVDLFARGTTSIEIVGFKPSPETHERARCLLDRSKSNQLTEDEAGELERLGQIESLMQLVKARARYFANIAS
jgi:hypothetical protein